MARSLLVPLLLILAPGVAAQTLWRGVPVGATPAEVRAAVPSAERAEYESFPMLSEDVLRVGDLTVCGMPFEAVFFFDDADRWEDRALTRVGVYVVTSELMSDGRAEVLYRCLVDALTYKYGAPLRLEPEPEDALRFRRGTWMNGATNVSLLVAPTEELGFGVKQTPISVTYGTGVARNAANL